jgi:hypothetical protein
MLASMTIEPAQYPSTLLELAIRSPAGIPDQILPNSQARLSPVIRFGGQALRQDPENSADGGAKEGCVSPSP